MAEVNFACFQPRISTNLTPKRLFINAPAKIQRHLLLKFKMPSWARGQRVTQANPEKESTPLHQPLLQKNVP